MSIIFRMAIFYYFIYLQFKFTFSKKCKENKLIYEI